MSELWGVFAVVLLLIPRCTGSFGREVGRAFPRYYVVWWQNHTVSADLVKPLVMTFFFFFFLSNEKSAKPSPINISFRPENSSFFFFNLLTSSKKISHICL